LDIICILENGPGFLKYFALLILQEKMSSPSVFSEVHVVQCPDNTMAKEKR
jgi:hypothetical protein